MDLLYDTLFNGLAIGSVLVLAALGLAVVFGLMGVINMAHGELMMLGAYTTFVVQNIFKAVLPDALFPIYILVAIPLAFLVSGLAGLLLEKTVIRRLSKRLPSSADLDSVIKADDEAQGFTQIERREPINITPAPEDQPAPLSRLKASMAQANETIDADTGEVTTQENEHVPATDAQGTV